MRLSTIGGSTFAALALLILAYGCSSAVGSPTPTYGHATSAPAQTANVTFAISPGSAASPAARARRPAYLSTATSSVSILPIVTGAPNQKALIVDIGAGLPGCTGSGTSLTCSGSIAAPVGPTSFTVTTYDQKDALGDVLSSGTITVQVAASSTTSTLTNATSLTLNGVPASFAIAVSPQSLTIGSSATLSAVITAYDAAGAAIVGPGQYATGIDLETITAYEATSDAVLTSTPPAAFVPGCTYPVVPQVTACHLVTVVTGPSQPIALAYKGEYVPGTSILLAGESPGLATQSVTIPFASPPPSGACTGTTIVVCPGQVTFATSAAPSVALTVSEPGVTTFTASDYACVGDGIASINFQKQTSGTAFTVYPGTAPGTCAATFTDAAGNSTNVNVTLLATVVPSPSPSPSTTPAPTPVPTGPIAISPSNALEFTSATASPQQITAAESGGTTFSVQQSACSGIVSVTPANGTVFTVTPQASLTQGGTCTFFVVDASGGRSPVQASVDGVSFIINSKSR
jgi:hypothetical protein